MLLLFAQASLDRNGRLKESSTNLNFSANHLGTECVRYKLEYVFWIERPRIELKSTLLNHVVAEQVFDEAIH